MSFFLVLPKDFIFIFNLQKFEYDMSRFLFLRGFVLFVFFNQLLVFSKLLRSVVWHPSLILENSQPYTSNIAPVLFFLISSLSRIPVICTLNCLILFHNSWMLISFSLLHLCFRLGHFCWPIFSFTDSFHSSIEPTDKLVNGICYLYFFISIIFIWLFSIISIFLLKFIICILYIVHFLY